MPYKRYSYDNEPEWADSDEVKQCCECSETGEDWEHDENGNVICKECIEKINQDA